MNHFVVQGIELFAHAELLRVDVVDLPLHVQDVHDGIGIQEQLQDRIQQLADEPHDAAMRFIECRVFESVVRRLGAGAARSLELFDKVGADALRIEKSLELDVGQLLDLLLGIVDAALFLNPRPNLAHDLLDDDRVGANVELSHMYSISSLTRFDTRAARRKLRRFPQARAENAD